MINIHKSFKLVLWYIFKIIDSEHLFIDINRKILKRGKILKCLKSQNTL